MTPGAREGGPANPPKRLPCSECGIKPQAYALAHGWSDKDEEFYLECRRCKKRTPKEFAYEKREPFQTIAVTEEWNRMNGLAHRDNAGEGR